MSRLNILVEGQTEESFVKNVLSPALAMNGVYASARILGRPGQKGGRVSFERAKKDISLLLKQERESFCTTLFDFYGLGPGFPGLPLPKAMKNQEKAARIEQSLKAAIIESIPPGFRVDARFLPYLQVHEYESLLFSDPFTFASSVGQPSLSDTFREIREGFSTPEDINDDSITAPSKRVIAAYPSYRKVIDGTLAANAIGLIAMRRECPRFHQWLLTIEALPTKDFAA